MHLQEYPHLSGTMQRIINKFIRLSIFAILACLGSCHSQESKLSQQKTPELTASLGGTGSFLDTIGVIYIATTIYNPTTDTIRFVSMTCSYEDLFTTDTGTFKIQSRYDCYSNYPTVIILPPNARTNRYIMVTQRPKVKDTNADKLKVGMYYLPYPKGGTFDDIINLYEHRQNAAVIWSNQLDLKRFYKINY